MAKRLCLGFFLVLLWNVLSAQPFPCDGRMYVALLDQGQGTSGLYAITPGDSLSEASISPIQTNLGAPIQVLGFSVADNHIYGFSPATARLYRINASGQMTDLGVPNNLDTLNFTYLAGEIGPNGNPFILIARSKVTGYDARFYSVRFNQANLSASWVSVVSDVPVRIEDVAYDPILGELVGYDSANNRMVSVNTAGVVTAAGFSAAVPLESMGSLFFNRKGQLFGYGGRTNFHNNLYQFNRINGSLTGSVAAAPGRNSDGCACPYQIHFTKRIEPAQVLPCSEVTITYHFHNTAAIAYGLIHITDTLPDIFTITSIERPPFFGEIQSGIGTNIFDATGMQVLLAQDSVVIRARIGNAAPGLYGSRASAGPFPLGLGRTLHSDDPGTPATGDVTLVEILADSDILEDSTLYICAGASVVLRPSVQGQNLRWSTGSEAESISVSTPGLYAVEVEGECGVYRDSIRVEDIDTGLWADLGPDAKILPGESIRLNVQHNSSGPLQYRWSAATDDSLSCTNCATPVVSPQRNTVFSVTITDANGCTASDEIHLSILRDVPVFVPNAFSPNGNGINDILFVQGVSGIEAQRFQVFDRWGGMVFHSSGGRINDPAHGWNGKRKGLDMPEGMYLWVLRIRFADGHTQEQSGEVFLMR